MGALNQNAAQDNVSSLHHPQIDFEERLRKKHLNNEVSHSSFGNNQLSQRLVNDSFKENIQNLAFRSKR